MPLQIKQYRTDMQQEMKEKLYDVSSLVSDKIATFRSLMTMLKTDVKNELTNVHNDQAHTMKRTLERIERLGTVSASCLYLLS